jgi:peptide/nickel transport system permease protein
MTAYIIRRVIIGFIILLLVTIMVFLFVRLLPGDPLMVYMANYQIGAAQSIGEEQIEFLRAQFGLDKPLPVQYINWLGDILHGDLGESIVLKEDITTLMASALPKTAYIGALSMIIGTFLGILAGIIVALRRGTWTDNVITLLANVGITMPQFWLGILLMYFFAFRLGWLPTSGWTNPFEDFWMSTQQIIMPVICLAVGGLSGMCRLTRSCMLEVMRQDYVRTAWAKGLRERLIVWRHQIRNAVIPIVTVLGGTLGAILGGAVIIENVFAIPGMGRLMVTGVFDQDYQIVQAGVLIFGGIVIFSNLLVDIAWAWIDPRIRYD